MASLGHKTIVPFHNDFPLAVSSLKNVNYLIHYNSTKSLGTYYYHAKITQCGHMERELKDIVFYVKKKKNIYHIGQSVITSRCSRQVAKGTRTCETRLLETPVETTCSVTDSVYPWIESMLPINLVVKLEKGNAYVTPRSSTKMIKEWQKSLIVTRKTM